MQDPPDSRNFKNQKFEERQKRDSSHSGCLNPCFASQKQWNGMEQCTNATEKLYGQVGASPQGKLSRCLGPLL